jgi:NitT/TauT family transport system ATP-binding protein
VSGVLRLRDVSFRFSLGASEVLSGVDLDIAPGELVSLLGASGSGKSTLLSLLAGLERPTSGSIEAPPAAMVFQEPALLPWLTVLRNVELPLRLGGMSARERRQRASELLSLVRLSDAGDRRPHELSGGMRHRAAIARALGQDRPLLLMDEPFAALDAVTREHLHDEVERIWRETGRTIVFVTHDPAEAVRLGRRVLLLSSRPGRVVAEWNVELPGPRRLDSPAVARLARTITDRLRAEIQGPRAEETRRVS